MRPRYCLGTAVFAVALAVAPSGSAISESGAIPKAPAAAVAELRAVTSLDKLRWRFIQDDNMTIAAALANDGSAWSAVELPHTWNASDAASIAQTTPSTPGYKRGRGWYRLEFQAPVSGATHWLQFDGASIVTDVWLNGRKVGRHRGAFTAFRFDVTRLLRQGTNVLLVRTDNSAPKAASDPTAIIPLSGDFNVSGGLYRSVFLVSTPDTTHIALDDFGATGVYAETEAVEGGAARVSVRVKLENDGRRDRQVSVMAALIDAAGRPVGATTDSGVRVDADNSAAVSEQLTVPHAHLWDGLADPYLYKLVVELRGSRGRILDRVVQAYGIREIRFDPDKGFFLNGRAVRLHGVNLHQDYLGKGWAISAADTDRSLALIREIGANAIRLAHYPHSRHTLDQTDRLGFVVWAELPFVNESTLRGACDRPASEALTVNAKRQLTELIRQQFNHPSIAMWSIGNEVATGILACMDGHRSVVDNVRPLLRKLTALAHAEDPGRVTTLADLAEGRFATGGITDIWAVNRYYLWYQDESVDGLGRELDALHRKYPAEPLGVSEYGAGAAITQHTDNPLGGLVTVLDQSNRTRTAYQPEGYASYVHEQNYAVIESKPYLWGSFVWNMFDFGSSRRHEGDIGGTNTKGLVTLDRRVRKDPFFFYQANWSNQPVVHITGKRYVHRAYRITDVKVYSNASSTSLSLNGRPVGTMDAAGCPDRICLFKNVTLHKGANTLIATGSYADSIRLDTATWHLDDDNARNVYIAAGQVTTGFVSSQGHRFGSDNFFVGGRAEALYPTTWSGSRDKTPIRGVAAQDEPLYANVRVSDGVKQFGYEIPVANGAYSVTLGFLEPDQATAVGRRVFDVLAQGVKVISNLDVLHEAAGRYRTAIAPQSFDVSVTNGRLRLEFRPVQGGAVVSNIAVTKR